MVISAAAPSFSICSASRAIWILAAVPSCDPVGAEVLVLDFCADDVPVGDQDVVADRADGFEGAARSSDRVIARTRIDVVGAVADDVDNPLLGPRWAAAVYGPQKGADPDDVVVFDAALARWADVVDDAVGPGRSGAAAPRDRPGVGAAGGVGYAAMAVLGGELEPGIGLVLDLIRFADHLPGARLVITGEGSLDEQTLSGKAPAGVAAAALAAGVPVVTVSGRLALTDVRCGPRASREPTP